ncbi:phosphoribosylanthranilate isomerase [Litorimonas sp. RW-G-Af-16]|uniref:phosphoribosylanthranilate isomerase n=1 Tax=Litorimonas sp. RW-G-Af-16 TaxID=3241168 RepID=UPI00390C801D
MQRQVKICGLTRAADVQAAIKAGADFLGFIVECPSKRRVSVSEAGTLAPTSLPVPRVAVTVNPNDELLARIMAEMSPDYIQLHGDETLERVAEVGLKFKVKVIKAAGVSTADDIKLASEYSGAADLLLLDAKPPKGTDVRGGHGIAIDWQLIKQAPLPKTYLLAGGLTPHNVAEAIALTNAPILDVSSGLEAAPGIKDHAKMDAFMKAVRGQAHG